MSIVAVIGLILTCAIGIWNWIKRLRSEKRKIADDARKKLDDAKTNSSPSDFVDAFDSMRRLR